MGVIPIRYLLAALNSLGHAIVYGLKVNLSVAIVVMVNHTAVTQKTAHVQVHHNATECDAGYDNVTKDTSADDGPFEWDSHIQGYILGAYFWGYIVTQLPGGRLSEMFSAKHLFGLGVMLNILGTVFSPIASKGGYPWLILLRIIEGFGGGVTLPATHVLLAHWSPPVERSTLSAIVYAGMSLGTVISLPLSGIMASDLGWESVFYIQGSLGVIWYLLWLLLVTDEPTTHRLISDDEKEYICKSIGKATVSAGTEKRNISVPWRSVFTSMPFYAIMVAHMCNNWGWYMLLVELPTFMKQVLGFDIKSNSLLSALPYFIMWLFGIAFGYLGTFLRDRQLVSTTVYKKIATGLASLGPGICLALVTYMGCNRAAAVTLLTIGVSCIAGMYGGFLSNHIDIAPNFAGTLMALTNTMATIPGITVPIIVGAITHGDTSVYQWRIIFFITTAIYLFEFVFYTIFSSGNEQPWNRVEDAKEPEATISLNMDSPISLKTEDA
ncbi:unnamed protein product [Darwinula stevensoni]|uniref:Sialin n=1 Tax=Darwinula stevensoni TaxID=69355 RepID=A0A7R9A5S5_9CRUS|nr:unnamed protein product [Darwinula stevensoni]CAG0885884.1 unnamed protein product [Darwinula stevensoni]